MSWLWASELWAKSGASNKADIESAPVLAGDRQGFEITSRSHNRKDPTRTFGDRPVLDLSCYNDFDLTIVFPNPPKHADKTIETDDAKELLFRYCTARVGKNLHELNTTERLHPVYGIGKSLGSGKEMTRAQFASLIKKVLFRVLNHINAIYVSEDGLDKDGSTFVRIRLSEKGCRAVADYKNYPLQVSRDCTRYAEFINDAQFAAPYIPYEEVIEKETRKIWQRYDRLGLPIGMNEGSNEETSLFRDVDRIRLLRMAFAEFINVDLLLDDGWIASYYCLKQTAKERALRSNWASLRFLYTPMQPLDEIRDYFGEEVALYYAWLGYYTKCLTLPAIVGLVVGIIGRVLNRRMSFDNPIVNVSRLVFCVFIGVWSTLFFTLWQRKEKEYTLRWGVEDAQIARVSNEPNPFFEYDKYVQDPIQPDRFLKFFSPHKRRARMLVTGFIMLLSCVTVTLILNEDLLDAGAKLMGQREGYTGIEDIVRMMSPSETVARHAAQVVVATSLVTKAYDKLFGKVLAKKLSDFENHQFMSGYSNSLNLKLFCVKIFGYFAVLFYLAFFKEFFNPCEDTRDGRCLPRLGKQLITFYLLDLVLIASEFVSPYAKYLMKKVTKKPQDNLPRYQRESYLSAYVGSGGLTGEYLDKIIQFGYTALFSMACPFLPTLAFLVNSIELRTDAFKLTTLYQRPFPKQAADSLGIWDDIQRAMTFFGILSNVLLCTFATVGHDHSLTAKLTVSLVLLLMALGMKDYCEYKLPKESEKYNLLKARMQVVDYEAMWGDGKKQL